MSTIKVIEVPSRDSFVSTELALQVLAHVLVKVREAMIEDGAVLVTATSGRTLLIIDQSQEPFYLGDKVKELSKAGHSVQVICMAYPDSLDLALIEQTHEVLHASRQRMQALEDQAVQGPIVEDYEHEPKVPHMQRAGLEKWAFKKGRR